jgi:hypothetical protein
VYRTLNSATALGSSARPTWAGEAEFEWIGVDRHHHLVCRSCGDVTSLDNTYLDSLATALHDEIGFQADLGHFAIFASVAPASPTMKARPNAGGIMLRPPLLLLALTVATAALLSACGGDDDDGDSSAKLQVITTVSPITSIVENIGGTAIDLQGVIPEGVNSHTFEPPPSIVGAIEDADLIILNGLKLEEPTLELAESNKKGDAVILLLDGTLTPERYKYDFSFPESEGKPNPHLWPNPELATTYATLVHEKLVGFDAPTRTTTTPTSTPSNSASNGWTSRCASPPRPFPRRTVSSSPTTTPGPTGRTSTASASSALSSRQTSASLPPARWQTSSTR